MLEKLFVLKCNLSVLRLTPLLTLLLLPFALTRLQCYHQRVRLTSMFTPSIEAVVMCTFPVAWFFGFLYYTDVPSLLGVVASVVAATQNRHWLAALVRMDAESRLVLKVYKLQVFLAWLDQLHF